ncbi:2-(1,2-epoxy-1,2-dihydrophenyl)acetyl-CoA isomerase [Klenkia marina]|uniref:2-(1,2-epoxy-1,2-dihydrophenyl)acetyl-CoA isomerase n=1 Tax=Klenkia marina TaxID=1960309 RepID=A0A1G4XCM2_9ACTN|nr:enoyl-CoA hydratase-related protein [Klenkia marina]SCX38704.1 2-(1,2-epoxy-1,2-dihydrophenyl)acetyl-CoA isomerase [Klenkia marina]
MDTPHRITTGVDGDVWRVVLDRPDAGNAIDLALADALVAALADRPASTRAVLLLGNGPRFCVGGDVAGMAAAEDRPGFIGALADRWHDAVRAVVEAPVPVVAGVQGAVAGAGVGLVGACDLVVCARSTKIRPAYGAIGLSPDGGTSWALARTLGAPRALELMLTDGTLTAAQAHEAGLVARLADDESLAEAATALAHQVAAGPVRAMVRTRGLVRRAATTSLYDQLDEEARLIVESAEDAEAAEGIAAFAEKRAADFRNAP